jgi:hypothetical protein
MRLSLILNFEETYEYSSMTAVLCALYGIFGNTVNFPKSVEVDFLEENPLSGCGFGLNRSRKCYRVFAGFEVDGGQCGNLKPDYGASKAHPPIHSRSALSGVA